MKFSFYKIFILLCIHILFNVHQQYIVVNALKFIKLIISQSKRNAFFNNEKRQVIYNSGNNDDNNVSNNKIKVLCLHGYLSNSLLFQEEMQSITQNSDLYADFTFINAANKFSLLKQSQITTNTMKRSKYRWWDAQENISNTKYNGLLESLLLLNDIEKSNGPFDVIISHSQGGCLAIIVDIINKYPDLFNELAINTIQSCTSSNNDNEYLESRSGSMILKLPKPDLRIIIGGFLPRDDCFRSVVEDLDLTEKSLHVYSINDQIVLPELSIKALSAYRFPTMAVHDSNQHNLPFDTDQVSNVITNAIHKIWKNKFNKTMKICLEE